MITEKDQAILDDVRNKLLDIECSMKSLSSGGFDGLLKNISFTFNAVAYSQEYGIPLTGNQFDYDLHGFRFRIVEDALVVDVPLGAYILSNDYNQDLYEEMLEEIFQTIPLKERGMISREWAVEKDQVSIVVNAIKNVFPKYKAKAEYEALQDRMKELQELIEQAEKGEMDGY